MVVVVLLMLVMTIMIMNDVVAAIDGTIVHWNWARAQSWGREADGKILHGNHNSQSTDHGRQDERNFVTDAS